MGIIEASLAPIPAMQDDIDIVAAALAAPRRVEARIFKRRSVVATEAARQLVYCVALEPHTIDLHKHMMTPEDVEFTAHRFMELLAEQPAAQMVRAMHEQPIHAVVVESYIAPQDLVFRAGPYGPQRVAQGSWVLGIHVRDPAEWAKVVSGDYTGISVGGTGLLGRI